MKLRPGVTFHDGEKIDAAAVKFNIERHKTMRRLEPARRAAAGDAAWTWSMPLTVQLNLSAPFSPLLTVLADRAGMMVSPKAAQAAGDNFGARPVCSGPFKFVERVAQDRIVVERFANYWNKGRIHFDKVTFQPIIDATVRLANLRSGQLDFIERVAPPTSRRHQEGQQAGRGPHHRTRLPGHHHQHRQERPGAEEPAGPRPAGARGLRAVAGPPGHRPGGDGQRSAVGNQWVPPSNRLRAECADSQARLAHAPRRC